MLNRARPHSLLLAFALLPGLHGFAPHGSPSRGAGSPTSRSAPRVRANDNRVAAGTVRNGVRVLDLEARIAEWHPDGDAAPGAPVFAFAEVGQPAQIPGPLVRVRAGTAVDVSIRNTLPDTMRVYGLYSRSASEPAGDSALVIAPGARITAHMQLGVPGTFLYWGTTMRRAINFRTREDAQLTGAIVVDAISGARPSDRVVVIGSWTDTVHRAGTHRQRVLGVMNGLSWPHTERLTYTAGDTVHWRLVNGSADLHPMHLHGFYFRIDARGDSRRDTVFKADDRRLAVTENMEAGGTLDLTWVPERAGNWLFHCHIPEHFGPRGPLGTLPVVRTSVEGANENGTSHLNHAMGGMNGLVMGIAVLPRRGAAPAAVSYSNARRIRLIVRANRGSSSDTPFYSYALQEGNALPPADSGLGVGPTLDLVRAQPVQITVVNQLDEPTAVHWHGIELESFYDGVPGFSGAAAHVTPLIAARDSFVVRFTPPRAGTFIYHTHAMEERQQLAGLAGAIVVREPGTVRDTMTDIPIVLTAPTDLAEQSRSVLVNGRSLPLSLKAGTTYRLRFIQMSASRAVLFAELQRDGMRLSWRPLAKDGADLPPHATTPMPARVRLGIGETYDVAFTPDAAGDFRLDIRLGALPPRDVLMTSIPVRVRP